MKTKNMIIISVVIALFAVLVLAHFETSPNMAIDSGLNISEVIVMAKDTQNGATISGINLSGTVIFNISVNNTNGTNGLAGWNVTNISIMFNHTNSSIVGNFSTNNLSNNQLYFNISIDTTELEDGVYTLMGMISNYTGGSIGTGESPRTNYTLAVNVSIDNSPPNVTLPSESSLRVFSRNLTGMDVNQSFNITVSDETFYELNDNNGTNVENVTFSFTNATGTGFNVTVPNATAVNTTSAVWGVLYNISALHGGSHTVRVFAYNYHGKLNDSVVFNFTVNSAHNVTLHPGVGDYVTQGANYSAINTTVLFNASVINATGTTSKGGWIGAPTGRSPIAAVIFMFNNGSGTAFNISNTSNAIAGQYWNISFNVSNLAEGDHTVTVFANDTLGNYNKTESFSFVVDKSGPGISIVCDTGKTVGESVLCTCTSEAGSGSGIKEAAKFLGETGNTKTVTHSSAGTFTSSTCSSIDYAGNRGTGTQDYTVTETVSSSGSTGGSGGGTSSGVSGQTAKKVWTSLNAGDKASVPVSNGAIGVTEVSFGVKDIAYGAWVQVKKRDSFPSSVASLGSKTYRSLEISKSSTLKDDNLKDTNIDFKVEKKWLADNGLVNNQIDLFRYVNGEWVALNARVTSTSGDYVQYTAETPGFSYFAIAEKKGVTPEEVVKETTDADVETVDGSSAGEEATSEAPAKESRTWPWVVAILVVIVAGVIYWWKTK